MRPEQISGNEMKGNKMKCFFKILKKSEWPI